ncbi:MAG: ATP-dependent sacrificial sulfur transferase LarE [Desulfatitalea sp.]|nr:ATP-dependent sacrificial sulfur transferase LarE [Desulfatitalea sp.]
MHSSKTASSKLDLLYESLRQYGTLGVAFSGGVDSTLLLAAARRVLGSRVVAFTAQSPIHPSGERDFAKDMARQLNVQHVLFATDELHDPLFTANGQRRCYHCKQQLFVEMGRQARSLGIHVLAHGVNLDDLADFRPGLQAAREAGVVAPLIDAGLSKHEIRILAQALGLPNWDRPAMACLASRIPYGTPIEAALLSRIDQAEAVIRDIGGVQCRVRHHGNVARIEVVGGGLDQLVKTGVRRNIVDAIRALGYDHVCLDLEGYVSGKMNRGMIPE